MRIFSITLVVLFLGSFIACSQKEQASQQSVQQSGQNQQQQLPQTQMLNQQTVQQVQNQMNREGNVDVPDVADIHNEMEKYQKQFKNLKPIDQEKPNDPHLVQLALLLDTSNSMDGMINQAKSQLWSIVNELSKSQKGKEDIRLEVALYEYGNDNLLGADGYIRQVVPFTEDLDLLSESLFALKTKGGAEYCGYVIGVSLSQLKWNLSNDGLKIIYIAGNEPFSQGPINFKVTCALAAERKIVINTIHCAGAEDNYWQMGSTIGKGSYFSIDSDKVIQGIPTPYDDELIQQNQALNKTYIPYGHQGQESWERQQTQDSNAWKISKSNFAQRIVSKGSKFYKTSNWDLVDTVKRGSIDIKKINKKELPKELQNKTTEELIVYIEQKNEEREKIQKNITELNKKQSIFLAEKRAEKEKENSKSLGAAILDSLRDQAKKKNFDFK